MPRLPSSLRPTLLAATILAPALLAPATGWAQSLQEALAQAYANNPTLQTARAQLRVVDENVPQALAGWRPSVTVAGNAGYVQGTTRNRGFYSDADRTTAGAQATLTQPVYSGGRTVAAT
ncbi:TolC family protein, partial [Teichococcus cervicalis]